VTPSIAAGVSVPRPADARVPEQRHRVVIRFAGDSGDGMRLTGDRFTAEAAAFGNDLATLPNFPAEMRAPHGTLAGSRGSSCTSPTTTF
jgi:hypothetical protein